MTTDLSPRRSTAIIAEELRSEVDAAEADYQSAVQHAIRAGELLVEAKAQVKHGEWLPWLEANFPGSERSAQTYMRLARKSATVADLPTIGVAVAALAPPKPDQPDRPEMSTAMAAVVAAHEHAWAVVDEAALGDDHLANAQRRVAAAEVITGAHSDDHVANARRLVAAAEAITGATRAAGRELLEDALREGNEPCATALARAGSALMRLADLEPWDERYDAIHTEVCDALRAYIEEAA